MVNGKELILHPGVLRDIIRTRPSLLNLFRKVPKYVPETGTWKKLRESKEGIEEVLDKLQSGAGRVSDAATEKAHQYTLNHPYMSAILAAGAGKGLSTAAENIENESVRNVVTPLVGGLGSALPSYILSRNFLGAAPIVPLATMAGFLSGLNDYAEKAAYRENYEGQKERSKIRKQIKKEKIDAYDKSLVKESKHIGLRAGQFFKQHPTAGIFGIPMALTGVGTALQQSDIDPDIKHPLGIALNTAGLGTFGTGVGLGLGARLKRPYVGGLLGALLGAGYGISQGLSAKGDAEDLVAAKVKRQRLLEKAQKELDEVRGDAKNL